MTGGEQGHWTADGELLAQYVLERVPPDARTALEAHLAACEPCRQAVAEERLLAAGIRLAGRERLQHSLAERIHARPAASPPWPRIFAAAAVIVIALGVALYSRWVAVESERPEERGQRQDKALPATAPPQSQPATPADRLKKKDGGAPAEGAAARNRLAEQPARKAEAGTGAAAAPQTGFVSPDPEMQSSWWSGRRVLPGDTGDSLMGDVQMRVEVQEEDAMESISRAISPDSIRLDQRPLGDLPRAGNKARAERSREDIPIRAERRDGRLHITLYTAVPFDAALLRAATLRWKAEDSLLLTIGNEIITVHIPPGEGVPGRVPPLRGK